MAGRTVMVLGGGVGGVVAARRLRQKLGSEHRVLLVDKEDRHYFPPSFPWVMVSRREPHSTYRHLSGLSRKGIEIIQGEVTAIDVDQHQVATSSGDLSWDYLVIALGTEMTYDNVPGLKEASHTYYSLEGAVELRNALDDFTGGNLLVTVAGVPYRCPAAPYEGTLLIDHYLRRQRKREDAQVKFFTLEPAPMPVAGPEIGGAVEEMLARRDVSFGPPTTTTKTMTPRSPTRTAGTDTHLAG
jgi:sulfide:quinone oxidoreductase